MQMSPQQANDFVKVLGPTLKNAGLGVNAKIICGNEETWLTTKDDSFPAIANDPIASSYVPIYSGHGYLHPPDSLVASPNSGKRIWQTEWGTFKPWTTAWDQGDIASGYTDSGFIWAQQIYTALTAANVSAFFYWWGAADDPQSKNQTLIRLNGTSFDASNAVSKRLWAFSNYSRFVRPTSTRICTTTSNNNSLVTAFSNTNGSLAIVVLNTATQAMTVPIAVPRMGFPDGSQVVPHITNTTNNTAKQDAVTTSKAIFPATLPSRSLVTYIIPASKSA